MAERDDDLERAVALGAGDFQREAQDAGLGDDTARQDAQENGAPENGAPENAAGSESEPAADGTDLHDPRNRDNWRVENWRVT